MKNQVNYENSIVLVNNNVLNCISNNATGRRLERTEMIILLVLTANGAVNQPKKISIAKLAELCGCSPRGVAKAVKRLQDKTAYDGSEIQLNVVSAPDGTEFEIRTNDKNFTIINQSIYNRLIRDLIVDKKNKEKETITPISARFLCFIWRQTFGYHRNKHMLTASYIKSMTGTTQDREIEKVQQELLDTGYLMRVSVENKKINDVEQAVTYYEPRKFENHSPGKKIGLKSNKGVASKVPIGDSAQSAEGVALTVPMGTRSECQGGRNSERDTKNNNIKEDNIEPNIIDVSNNKDGRQTVLSIIEKSENSVLPSETDTNNSESTAEVISEEEDKDTIIAIQRFEAQKLMLKMGMAAEIAKLPPIEGLPDSYAVNIDQTTDISSDDYSARNLIREIDEIIKDIDDFIANHTNPTMPSIINHQVSSYS